ncbi:hypothetical protein [Cellulomonas alba]|uniref:ABC transporter permease n=1 Tax=Cellulomonas alba TaxID=3053467 RepID=A0ABT7SEQ6_9CELL|nr:hypothetical protein [Cellulomonas alba]MDM7854677.1 hypothetical protein [Cellulomonas alba]
MSGLRFELVRAAGLRSTWLLVGLGLGVHTLVTGAVAAFVAYGPAPAGGYTPVDVARLVVSGPPFLPLAAAILGAVLGGMDHRHRLLELSLLVTPRRGRLLAGKAALVTLAAAALAVAGVLAACALLAATGLPLGGVRADLVLGQVARVLAWGLGALMLALALRSQTAAVVAVVAGAFLVEPAVRAATTAAPRGWWTHVPDHLVFASFDGLVPTATGGVFTSAARPGPASAALVTCAALGLLTWGAWRSLRGGGARGRGGAAVA